MATQLSMPTLSEQYASAAPFPHIVLDHFFDRSRVTRAAAEVAAQRIDPDADFYGQRRKGGFRDLAAMGEQTASLIREMNDETFVRRLEDLTGISNLVADPTLAGGGVHQISRGGFLKVHTDFNWHAGLQMHRRVNVLLYLNPEWRDEWHGHLELWNTDMSARGVSIAPTLGRLVVFSTTDDSYHGHPDPLDCPEDVTRNSIALYYYSEEPAPKRQFGASQMTNYRPRPGERFASVRHKAHQILIALPSLRGMLKR